MLRTGSWALAKVKEVGEETADQVTSMVGLRSFQRPGRRRRRLARHHGKHKRMRKRRLRACKAAEETRQIHGRALSIYFARSKGGAQAEKMSYRAGNQANMTAASVVAAALGSKWPRSRFMGARCLTRAAWPCRCGAVVTHTTSYRKYTTPD